MNKKSYNGPQYGPINEVNQVYLARGCLSVEKECELIEKSVEVYIVLAGWHYEGSEIYRVCATEELAEIAKTKAKSLKNYDYVKIYPWVRTMTEEEIK